MLLVLFFLLVVAVVVVVVLFLVVLVLKIGKDGERERETIEAGIGLITQ